MNIASGFPIEILGEIFFHAIDGPISNIQDNTDFPWVLNRVCKFWRHAFVTYPYLWTWITIDLAESDLNAVNKCLSLCLERSRNYPLNISLYLPTGEYSGNSASFTLVWKTFMSCSHRWRIVHLKNVNSQFITLISCTGATPILESLTIHSLTEDIGYIDFSGFQITPHLTRFTLRTLAALVAVQKWSIPWMQLTNLILSFEEIIGVDQLFVLFKQLRDIEELRLILKGDPVRINLNDFVHNSGTPHCLQHLRVLQICCIETLALITAPSLSELCLEGSELFFPPTGNGGPNEVVAEEIVSSFIQRSSCKIHKLTLSDFEKDPFTPLAQLFPDVVELHLTDATRCARHLLSPNNFPALRVLDCITHMTGLVYFMNDLLEILELHNGSSARCSATPLAKVISRPILEDGEVSVLVTTTDWVSFKDYAYDGSHCELNLTRQFLLPGKGLPPAPNGSPNTDIALSPPSSTLSTPLNTAIS